jgi:oligopeptidase B
MTNPPVAKTLNSEDPYAWLRDKNWPKVEDPEILAHINAENDYFEAMTQANKSLEQELYEELKARIKEDDQSYPVKEENYYYFTQMEKNKDYAILCRKNATNEEEILLDANILAEGKSSFALGATAVSKKHDKLVYAYDADGSERYNIQVRDLTTHQDLSDIITNTLGDIVWNKQGTGFYYIKLNDNWRPDRVFFHYIGNDSTDDVLIYQELDPGFYTHISHSSSEDLLIIDTGNGSCNESWFHDLNALPNKPTLTIKRREDHLYTLDHLDALFYLLTNDMGKNFRLVSTKDFKNNSEIIAHSDDYYLTDIALYNQYIVVSKRILGLNQLEYYDLKTQKFIDNIAFDEEVYQASISFTNKDDQYLRISYSSLTMPRSILEYDFIEKKLHPRKIDEIPSGYQPNLYQAKRLWATSVDGTKIPLSMVYRKDQVTDLASNPLLLYGYGSYGAGMSASFRSNIISLLDRGFIYVIAHIRGGDELGFDWYESAKFLTKKLTFDDFIASAEYLIAEQYTQPDKLAIMGGSAGGMLMGVVANQRPELFKAIIALVPFVDVLNTMLDESLPLTPIEFEEWGNPKDPEYYDYMKSYSPYDNITKQHYPAMLVTAGLTDPRVGYWEAAKWVAKLRQLKQGNNPIILKTDMDAGHAGKSGRFRYLEEVAMIYGFVLGALSK